MSKFWITTFALLACAGCADNRGDLSMDNVPQVRTINKPPVIDSIPSPGEVVLKDSMDGLRREVHNSSEQTQKTLTAGMAVQFDKFFEAQKLIDIQNTQKFDAQVKGIESKFEQRFRDLEIHLNAKFEALNGNVLQAKVAADAAVQGQAGLGNQIDRNSQEISATGQAVVHNTQYSREMSEREQKQSFHTMITLAIAIVALAIVALGIVGLFGYWGLKTIERIMTTVERVDDDPASEGPGGVN